MNKTDQSRKKYNNIAGNYEDTMEGRVTLHYKTFCTFVAHAPGRRAILSCTKDNPLSDELAEKLKTTGIQNEWTDIFPRNLAALLENTHN